MVLDQHGQKIREIPTLQAYQETIADMLKFLYPSTPNPQTEWPSALGKDKFGGHIYSPRVDVAVGPFATQGGQKFANEYDNLVGSSKGFIYRMIQCHLKHIGSQEGDTPTQVFERLREANPGARCFMAIEIEKEVSKNREASTKHIMRDAINATALGRIGIAVGWSDRILAKFIRVRRYLLLLASNKIIIFNTANLLILHREELQQAIQDTIAEQYAITT
jgi:hypothetical protein